MKQMPNESHSSQRVSQKIKISFFILIFVLTVFRFDIKQTDAAAIGDGVFIYDQTTPTTNVQSRTWTESTTAVSAATSPFAGSGVSKHIYTRSSETRAEILMGIQDTAGLLTIYKSSDYGATWVSQWTATVGDGNLKRFEITYEQTSGEALVVYSANVGTTNEIKYQTWNGTAWSGAQNLDVIRTTGTIYGIRAAERSGSNEIGIVWVDTNNKMSANLWTGTAWYGEPTASLISGTYLTIARSGGATPSAVPTRRGYDLAFESLSGDLMVVWGNDSLATTQVDSRYIFKTAGGAWGAAAGTAIANLTEDGEMIDIAPSPISDKIAFSTCSVDTLADCNFIVWNGSAWGTVASDTTAATAITGESSNNVEWLVDGTNEVAVITYSDAAGGGIDWYVSANGATPAVQTDNSTAPAIAGLERAGFSKVNPSDSREAVFIFEDANADIFVKRAYLTGTTVAWSNPSGLSTAIETAASVTGFNPIGFAFIRYVVVTPPTVTTQAVTDNTTGTTATGNGNVTSDGNSAITERGIAWSTSIDPTTSNSHATATGTTGAYTVNITGLTENTFYYARAYAINSAGTSYGSNVTFTTPLPQAAPSTVLNTADAISVSTKPTLNFTGTDINSDALEYNIQIDTANTFNSQGGELLITSHPESNLDGEGYISTAATFWSAAGQTFQATESKLSSVKFYLKKNVSPTGNAVAKLYNYTGTVGNNAVPTGAVLATSDNFDVSTLTSSYALQTFTFSGANQYQLVDGVVYIIVFEYTGGDATNNVLFGIDGSDSYPGNISGYTSGAWGSGTYDAIFYVYGTTGGSLIDSVSTTDAGFTIGHPFPSGAAKDYTVQVADTLAPGAYYWRARAIDPTGSNIYGAWATARSFTALACSATTTGLWNTGGNWTACSGAGGVPAAGDDVKINTGIIITQDVATPALNSLTINGTLNTINGGTSYNINSETLTLGSSGTLTANNSTINLTGTSGTLFTKSTGTFNAGTSTVNMSNSWKERTNLGSRFWRNVVSSSDGIKLAAQGSSGYIYTSTDSGVNWTERTTSGSRSWNGMTSSSDGTKLAALVYSGYVITSTDSGVNWTQQNNSGARNWYKITSSSDGTKLAAVVYGGYIYTSADSGVNWTQQTNSGSRNWISITSSTDGTKLAALVDSGYVYTSTNSGVNWTERTTSGSRVWKEISSSSDGTKIFAIETTDYYGGYIYTSNDSGVTWNSITSSGVKYGTTIASSSDGTKLASTVYPGYIYTSIDSGTTWTEHTNAGSRYWSDIASSSDGTKLVATDDGQGTAGYLYTYSTVITNIISGNPSLYNLTITGGGTRSLGEALTVANDLTISGGTLDTTVANHYNINAGRIVINGGTFTPQSSTVNLTGASGALFTLSSGTFTAGTSTLNMTGNGNATVNSGSLTFYNLTSSGTGTKTLGGALTLGTGGTLNVSAGTFNPSSYLFTGSGTNTLSVANGATLGVGASTFAGNYSAGFTTKTLSAGSIVNYLLNGNQTIDNTLSYSNLNTSVGGTKTLGGSTTVSNILTVGAGSTLAASTYTLNLTATSGTPFVVNGIFQASTSTVNYSGGSVTLSSGNPSYFNLTTSGTGTKSLGQALTVTGNLTISGGTLDTTVANHYDITAGAITINGGIFTPQSSTVNITGTGNSYDVVFDYTSGTFTAGTSTLKLHNLSSMTKVFNGGGQIYNNIWLAPGGSTVSYWITGNNTFNNFKDDGTAAHIIQFASGSTQTISTWDVSGTAGNLISINSTSTGTHTLNLVGVGAIADSDYLNIQHSIATPINTWYAGTHSVNNQGVVTIGSGWIFTAVPSGATYTQSGYRLFNNVDNTTVGAVFSSLNTSAMLNNSGDNFRLRLLTHIDGNLLINGQSFKLQYADKVSQCDVGFSGESYSDVTNNSNISYYNNFYPEDKDTLSSNVNDPTHNSDIIVNQSYVESNNFTNTAGAVSTGKDALWDFSLYDKGNASNTSYCLRIVKADGSLLDGYSFIPEITTAIWHSRGGGGVSYIETVATPNPIQTGGTNPTGGSQGFTACSDGIDNDVDTFIDAADANCHVGGNIGAVYVPTHDSEIISPGNATTGGDSGGGSGGDLGYLFNKIKSVFNLTNYKYLKSYLLGSALNPFFKNF